MPSVHRPTANTDVISYGKSGDPVPVHVLANDVDPDGRVLHVARLVKGTRCGKLTLTHGIARFTPPDAGCPKQQRAVYVATNGSLESNAASILIEPRGSLVDRKKHAPPGSKCYSYPVLIPIGGGHERRVGSWQGTFHMCRDRGENNYAMWSFTEKVKDEGKGCNGDNSSGHLKLSRKTSVQKDLTVTVGIKCEVSRGFDSNTDFKFTCSLSDKPARGSENPCDVGFGIYRQSDFDPRSGWAQLL